MTSEETKKYEDDLKEFAKDHFDFSQKLKWHFRQLPVMPKEARKVLTNNICHANGFLFLDETKLFVRVDKVERLKALILQRKENTGK